jgi:hypothetical protein
MWTVTFWKAITERAVFTMVEVLVPMLVLTRIDMLDWAATFWVVTSAGVLALLKGLLASRVGSDGPSMISAEKLAPPAGPDG